jgi:hypothetical protein
MTFPRLLKPRSRLHFFSAHWPSLNIMCSIPSRLRQPFERLVRWRIVAKVDSIGLLVRMLCPSRACKHALPGNECIAGKSKKAINSSRSFNFSITSRQLCVLSRTPSSMARKRFSPRSLTPMMTRAHLKNRSAWLKHRNKHNVIARWQFTIQDARIKLKNLYPAIWMIQSTSPVQRLHCSPVSKPNSVLPYARSSFQSLIHPYRFP